MKERPILFSGPMVRALLEDRKTQTRRLMKPQPAYFETAPHWRWKGFACASGDEPGIFAPYVPGDRLWVRETFYDNFADRWIYDDFADRWIYDDFADRWIYDDFAARRDRSTVTHNRDGVPYLHYRADGMPDLVGEEADLRWTPSIHMPRWASRLTLEICEVQAQRLQDITEEEALAEGIRRFLPRPDSPPVTDENGYLQSLYHWSSREEAQDRTAGAAFARLWDSINAKRGYSWESNPWAWAITFRCIELEGK